MAEFEQNVDVLAVLKEMLEVAHVGVLDTPVDFDLAHQLLLRPALGQAGLLDDLGSVDELGLGIDEFETFGEASLAEELSLEVPADADFSALLFKLFFHDDL